MHFWADQTKAMIGGENSQTRSPGSTGEGNWPRFVGNWFAPPSTQDFLGKVGLNIALAWLLPVAVVKQHDGDLHAVGFFLAKKASYLDGPLHVGDLHTVCWACVTWVMGVKTIKEKIVRREKQLTFVKS